jgi:hypothetical protein
METLAPNQVAERCQRPSDGDARRSDGTGGSWHAANHRAGNLWRPHLTGTSFPCNGLSGFPVAGEWSVERGEWRWEEWIYGGLPGPYRPGVGGAGEGGWTGL